MPLEHAVTNLNLRVVWYGRLAIDSGKDGLEGAKLILCHLVRVAIPAIFVSLVLFLLNMASLLTEVADEICSQSTRCPFSVHNIIVWQDIEAELLVSLEYQVRPH